MNRPPCSVWLDADGRYVAATSRAEAEGTTPSSAMFELAEVLERRALAIRAWCVAYTADQAGRP